MTTPEPLTDEERLDWLEAWHSFVDARQEPTVFGDEQMIQETAAAE